MIQQMNDATGAPKLKSKNKDDMMLASLGAIGDTLNKLHEHAGKTKTHNIIRDAEGNMKAVVLE
jgi:hypothetical protein